MGEFITNVYRTKTKHQAETDGLTGIFNRRSFDQELDRRINLFSVKGQDLALILFDLDEFKGFNDTYGYLEGDRLLKHITSLIA